MKKILKHKYFVSIIAVVLIIAIAIPVIAAQGNGELPKEPKIVSINLVTGDAVKYNPQYAIENGIHGLLEVGYVNFPESMSASRGECVNIPIFISFTSYDPDLESVDVLIDTSKEEVGLQRYQGWYEFDSEGNETKRGMVRINDLVSYDKSGVVTVKAGDVLKLNMFVDIPSDLPPLKSKSIMLASVGIDLCDYNKEGIFFLDSLGGKEVKLSE